MTAEAQTIPEDIMAAATAVEDEIMAADLRDVDTQLIIAKAILAERQRCAAIVENFASGRGISTEAVKARKVPSQTSVLMAQLIRGEA